MAQLMRVPEVAAGAAEVRIEEWLVSPGADVVAGQPIVVIETDKAVVEVESELDGVLVAALVEAGQPADVGSGLVVIGTDDERDLDVGEVLESLGVSSASGPAGAPAEARTVPDGVPPAPQTAGAADGPAETSTRSPSPVGSRIFASPLVRRMVRVAGIDLGDLTGTGPGGRIVRRDAEEAIARREAARDAATSRPSKEVDHAAGFEDVPHSRMRRAVARRLVQSKQEIPHFYLKRTARVDDLLAMRRKVNDSVEAKTSINDYVVRAVALAHVRVPDANVIWTEEAMRRFSSVDIAVAVASQRGLVTPVIRDAGNKTVRQLSAEVKARVQEAASGSLKQGDLEGGSIAITNLGMYGVDEFSAIISPPHSMILAVGAAREVPAVVEGAITSVRTLDLVVSVDHRAVDGALAADWLAQVVAGLEDPIALLV